MQYGVNFLSSFLVILHEALAEQSINILFFNFGKRVEELETRDHFLGMVSCKPTCKLTECRFSKK